jgi:hypothetical protein
MTETDKRGEIAARRGTPQCRGVGFGARPKVRELTHVLEAVSLLGQRVLGSTNGESLPQHTESRWSAQASLTFGLST